MRKSKIPINRGIALGTIVNEIYAPNENFVSFTLRLRESEINPETGRKDYYYVNFVAFGELAKKIQDNCSPNQVVMLDYYMTLQRHRDENGVLTTSEQVVVNDITFGDFLLYPNRTKVPYVNFGLIAGEFVNIKLLPKETDRAIMTLRTSATVNGNTIYHYANMLVKGDMIKTIEETCNQGAYACVEFKLTSERIPNRRRTKTNYVVTRLAE